MSCLPNRSSTGCGSVIWGWGLFEPVDDYRPERGPSHPELLDWLARDFVAHGCDLKHTIRLILTSRTYQLPYEPRLADHFDPADPTAAALLPLARACAG